MCEGLQRRIQNFVQYLRAFCKNCQHLLAVNNFCKNNHLRCLIEVLNTRLAYLILQLFWKFKVKFFYGTEIFRRFQDEYTDDFITMVFYSFHVLDRYIHTLVPFIRSNLLKWGTQQNFSTSSSSSWRDN